MKKRLQRISPLQLGIVLAVLYGLISLIVVPIFLLIAVVMPPASSGNPFPNFGIVFAVLIPILYAVLGFIGGVILGAVYNLVAKMTGGIEFEVLDLPSSPMSGGMETV